MSNQTGSGASVLADTRGAVVEAVGTARKRLTVAPRLGFLFASARHDLKVALEAARAAVTGCEFVASHTSGEFTEAGLTRGGVAVMLLASDTMVFNLAWAGQMKAQHEAAAKDLCARFADTTKEATQKGLGLSTTVLLVDGLAGTGERLVKEVMQGTRMFQQIVGGAAGDDGAFKATSVGMRAMASSDAAVAAHIFDKLQWGVGVDHGLRPKTKRMTVTKAKPATLYELDGRPAFDVYKEYAAERGVALEAKTAGSFLIGNELGVFFLDELHHARAPVSVGPSGELNLVADVEEGASVCILDGEPDSMIDACSRAAAEAKANLKGAKAAGVLVFDCVCRGMILGDRFQREIDAIRKIFPDTPVTGFLTYGEIARFRGRLDGWHNTTTVVAAIPA
jgi:methyl-accepting chemotaxis protein